MYVRVRAVLLALVLFPVATAHAQSREPVNWSHFGAGHELARQFEQAAATADLAHAMHLLSAGLDINYQFPDQQTLLHRAAHYGRLDFVDLLLEHGADALILDEHDRTAADAAMVAGHRDVAYLLVRIEDGEPNTSTAREDAERVMHHAGRDTRTGRDRVIQFMLAAFHNDVERMQTLITEGIDPNWVIGSNLWTPLLFAAKQGHSEIVDLLLAAGGDPAVRDHKSRNALDLARREGHQAVLAVLTQR